VITMRDPAPVVGLSPRDPLNGFAGQSVRYASYVTCYICNSYFQLVICH